MIVGVEDAYSPIRERFLDGAASMTLGYALEGDPDMGPVISGPHRDRVRDFIDVGVREGASLVLDGREATVEEHPRGHWIGPTVFENVVPELVVGREEIFGPVAGLNRADSIDSAIEMIHRIQYGNMTSIFTTSFATRQGSACWVSTLELPRRWHSSRLVGPEVPSMGTSRRRDETRSDSTRTNVL